jgi:hypothetical protein
MSRRRLALFVIPVTIGMTALTAAAFPVFAAAAPTTVTATVTALGRTKMPHRPAEKGMGLSALRSVSARLAAPMERRSRSLDPSTGRCSLA